ncbi:MAG: thioredoxin [Candidatus Thermoplasmatota archaeon]
MDEELEKIKKKKLDELKKKYLQKNTKDINDKQKKINQPLEISDKNIQNLINKHNFLVIDCWAPWCGPCKKVSPIIDQLAKEMSGEVVFGKLNVDHNKKTAQKFGVMSIPTLLVFKNGKLIDKIVGALPKEMLKDKLTQYK